MQEFSGETDPERVVRVLSDREGKTVPRGSQEMDEDGLGLRTGCSTVHNVVWFYATT